MMEAKPRFLMGAVDEIKEKYGSVVNYCKAELNVSDEDIEKMKAKYLE
ncbi:MAG: tyrosine-protein phosphatase [Candidatus Coproplasma sp.]